MTSVTLLLCAAFKLHCVDYTYENPVKSAITTMFTINLKFYELDSLVW